MEELAMPMGPCRKKDSRRPGPAAPPLPWALLIALVGAGVVVCQPHYTLPVPIDNIAASGDSLLLAGGNCIYKLNRSLSLLHLAHAAGAQDCAQPAGTHNKLLLPDLEGGRLLTGWTLYHGSCQVRFLGNLTVLTNQTEVVSCLPQGSTSGVLFALQPGLRLLALAAAYSLSNQSDSDLSCVPSASDANTVLTVRSLPEMSLAEKYFATLKRPAKGPPLHFVDAFLWGEHLFFPYYPLPPEDHQAAPQPSVAVLKCQKDHLSLVGELRLDCGARSTLLSSSLLEQAGLWAGVFSAEPGERRWDSTALCIFDMQQMAEKGGNSCRSLGENNGNRDCVSLPFTSVKLVARGEIDQLAPVKIPVRAPLS